MATDNSLTLFSFHNNPVRVFLDDNGNPWWVASDIGKALGIQNIRDAVNKRLKKNEKGVYPIYTPGGTQNLLCVNEPGLYRLIFRSDKQEALEFQDLVFEEILPSIRERGGYISPAATNEQLNQLMSQINILAEQKGVLLEEIANMDTENTNLKRLVRLQRRSIDESTAREYDQ